ncbi:DUF5597 domain-containing protein [Leifsonia sp. McL0607]|uniref:DUF5597 domain-containing protein n=1 Tax=Leifsonia sp. McL0607 TaxID=3415672 RepID=UPI003CFBB8F9
MKTTNLPRLDRSGPAARLIVDGAPFVIRGGELTNSGAERSYLAEFWPKLESLGINTVLAPVYWDVVEPAEGDFDWTLVDELLDDAREHGLRLVLLWFGSWKNSMSCYIPGWAKSDTRRFPRARTSDGRALEILTPFSDANRDADAHAFSALMRHLREVDRQHTVILVQVENEIGMIPQARDHSDAAEAAFRGAVPEGALPRDAEPGTWTEVFGDSPATDERFMAWAFARYVEHVTVAGKSELALPMYTNAALIRPGAQPGQYPSAGPLPHLADIWRAGAPSLDFLAPDIYFPNFADWADAYVAAGNPLFVAEALRSIDAAANALYAYGTHGALGFSPFGIETISDEAAGYLAQAFDVVRQLSPLIAEHAGAGTMTGLLPPTDDLRAPHRVRLDDVILEATYEHSPAPDLADGVINESGDARGSTRLPAAALVVRTAPDELVVAGIGVTLTFHDIDPAGDLIGILSCAEGRFEAEDGAGVTWRHRRWLNGDQTHQGRHVRLEPGRFAVQRVRLYRYR